MKSEVLNCFLLIAFSVALVSMEGCAAGEDSSDGSGSTRNEPYPGADSDGDSDGDSGGDGDGNSDNDADADSDGDNDADSDSDGDNDADSDSDGDNDADADTGTEDEVCSEQDFEIDYTPVRLMILVDVSSSMFWTDPQDTAPAPANWVHAEGALTYLLSKYKGTGLIDFGYDIFPDLGTCGVDRKVIFDCAPDNEDKIIANIQGQNSTSGMTPLCKAIRKFNAASYAPSFVSDEATSYLLVVSDGGDTCAGVGCGGALGEIIGTGANPANLATVTGNLLTSEIMTFAIGFGDGVDPAQLDAIVGAGGTGNTTYLDAANQTELEEAFDEITESLVSCVYEIDEPDAKADPDKVNFYFDDVVVGWDEGCAHDKGWTWTDDTHTQVEFCKEACDQLKAGEVEKISARFGCPTAPVVV